MKISLVDKLSPQESEHLFHWRERVFPEEGKPFVWAQSKWHLLAHQDDSLPLGHLGYGDFRMLLDDDTEITVVGIGGVVVRPEEQGKHIPNKLFEYLHESAHAKDLSALFVLFCPRRLESYYSKHGYTKFEGPYTFVQGGVVTSTNDFALMFYGHPLVASKIHIAGELW